MFCVAEVERGPEENRPVEHYHHRLHKVERRGRESGKEGWMALTKYECWRSSPASPKVANRRERTRTRCAACPSSIPSSLTLPSFTMLSDYDYTLPEELIAQEPLVDRASSRLLWLHNQQKKEDGAPAGGSEDTNKQKAVISHHKFSDILDVLQSGDLLVMNDTRVTALRLMGRKGIPFCHWYFLHSLYMIFTCIHRNWSKSRGSFVARRYLFVWENAFLLFF